MGKGMEPDSAGDSGQMDRLGILSSELVRDVGEWARLRIDLFGLEVARRIQARQTRFVTYGISAVAGAAALQLLLVAASLGLGSLLGSMALGFLVVGAAVALAVAGTYLVLRRYYDDEAQEDTKPGGRHG